jgi:hypothetical protein
MFKITVRNLAIAAAGMLALALPADAATRGGGGGGGGAPHIGGGGGGGGAPHFGGGGGGGSAVHFSAPAAHFSAPAISHAAPTFSRSMPMTNQSFARPALNGGVTRSFSHSTFHGNTSTFHANNMRSFSHSNLHANRSNGSLRYGSRNAGLNHLNAANRSSNATNRFNAASRLNATNRLNSASRLNAASRLNGARTLGAAAVGAGGAGAFAAHAGGGRWAHRDDWRRHRGFFGWAGPLFWPYAYDDLYDDIYWGDGPYYEDPFWAYGYGDIYGGLFSPYGYDGIAGWAPSRAARAGNGGNGAAAGAANRSSAGQPSQWGAMCGDDTREVANLPIERIDAAVMPTDEQRKALDALANASVQAAQIIKAACPSDVAFTPTARLQAMEQRVQAMLQAVRLIRPPLESFYNMLTDEQKARFNAIGHDQSASSNAPNPPSPVQGCGPNAAIPAWPQAQIEKAIHPNAEQAAKLAALRDANIKAAEMLKASCPSETPATPPARLAAVENRLQALLSAVQTVRAALDDFYDSLTDEQKAQFNGIAPLSQNSRPHG